MQALITIGQEQKKELAGLMDKKDITYHMQTVQLS